MVCICALTGKAGAIARLITTSTNAIVSLLTLTPITMCTGRFEPDKPGLRAASGPCRHQVFPLFSDRPGTAKANGQRETPNPVYGPTDPV